MCVILRESRVRNADHPDVSSSALSIVRHNNIDQVAFALNLLRLVNACTNADN